jgi:hypothetical protein
MLITDHPEWEPAGTAAADRRRWRQSPAATARGEMLPAAPASFGPPGPDLVQLALRADERNSGREAILGLVLAALMLVAVAEGWLWPVLAGAFIAAPIIGIGLESWDALSQWRRERRIG